MKKLEDVKPFEHSDASKKEQVEEMFDNIAGNYDLLNRILSLGIDRSWRKVAINMLKPSHPKSILDVATGTADLAIALTKLNPEKIVGLDLSNEMLSIGKRKIKSKQLENIISMQQGDSEALPFEDNTFDAVTVAFGVRNFGDLKKGLGEIRRVLNPDGKALILEFSKPSNSLFRRLYFFYFRNVLPKIGSMFSKDGRAYAYLPESVSAFPDGEAFVNILKETGFSNIQCKKLTFGISTIYLAQK